MANTTLVSETAYIDIEDFEGDSIIGDYTWSDDADLAYDLSSHIGTLQIKAGKTDTSFLIELSTANGRLILGSTDHNILYEILASETLALGVGKFFYDLELTDLAGRVNTLISGTITLAQSISRV